MNALARRLICPSAEQRFCKVFKSSTLLLHQPQLISFSLTFHFRRTFNLRLPLSESRCADVSHSARTFINRRQTKTPLRYTTLSVTLLDYQAVAVGGRYVLGRQARLSCSKQWNAKAIPKTGPKSDLVYFLSRSLANPDRNSLLQTAV